MLPSITVVMLAAMSLPFALASSCTSSNAVSWSNGSDSDSDPPVGASGGSSGGSADCDIICGTDATCLQACNSDPCAEQFGNDADALQACYAQQSAGDCNILGGSACDKLKKLKARATSSFSCSSSETCYEYTDGSLFCMDDSTGDYSDDAGGSGNVDTGEYTASDGEKTTVIGTGTTRTAVTSTATGNRGASTSSTKTTRTTTGATATSTADLVVANSDSGAAGLNAGFGIGAWGIVVALIL